MLWTILLKREILTHLVYNIQEIYENNKIGIETGEVLTDDICTNMGIRERGCLTPTLLNIYLDELIHE